MTSAVQAAPAVVDDGDVERTAPYWTARRVSVLLVAGGVLLRLWVVGAGWFLDADHVLRIRAGEQPFDLAYLTAGDVVGSSPGMAALQWPLTRTWPWDFTPLAAVLVVVQVVVLVLTAALCRRVWGDGRTGLVVLGLVSLSSLGPVAGSWWSAAMPASLVQLVTVSTLLAVHAWVRGATVAVLLPALVVWPAAATFGATALLAAPLAVLAVPLLDPRVRWRDRRWSAATVLTLALGAGLGVVLGPYLLPGGIPSSPPDVVAAALGGLVGSSSVALAGGPLSWATAAGATAVAAPPVWWSALVLQSLVVLGVLASARSARAALLWAWSGVWVLLCALDVVVRAGSGASETAELAARTLRWSGPLLLPLALTVGVSLSLLAPAVSRAWRSWRPDGRSPAGPSAIGVAAFLVLASVVSAAGFRAVWAQNPSRVFMVGAPVALGQAPADQPLLEQPVPPEALTPLVAPYNASSRFLASWPVRPQFADVATGLRVWTPLGALAPGVVDGVAGRPGDVPGCGWAVRGSETIPLQAPVVDFGHTVRVTYLASGDGSMSLQLGDGDKVTVPVRKGFGEVDANVVGGGDRVHLDDLTRGVVLCTDDVKVGTPMVAPVVTK